MKNITKIILAPKGLLPLAIILLSIFNFSFFINNCFSQWIQQYTGTTANLSSIKFINEKTGWACGVGTILKTTNGGTNWMIINHPVTNKNLTKIFPLDSNVVYCCGVFRTLIKTTDGGSNWTVLQNGPMGTGFSFFGMFFLNENTGWIGGHGVDKIFLKTTDGGLTFDSIYYGQGRIKDFYFRNENEGLYCGNGGTFKKTTNGGYNWFSVNIPVGFYLYDFRNFSFLDNNTGWTVVLSSKVFKTTDFGNNWDSISNVPNSGNSVHCIYFSSQMIGWSGGSNYSSMFQTTNGGYNWLEHYIPNAVGGTHSIYFYNDSIGWKVGNLGRIYNTTNGGQLMNICNNKMNNTDNFLLFQNYPNPFNSTTIIKFEIKEKDRYSLNICDIIGRKVDKVFNEDKPPGFYKIKYDGHKLNSGMYFYVLQNSKNTQTKKIVLIK